ncbi:hypothetical protein [Aeromonas schubertii]|uniref:hypothetical protein n=1 Tax=Aeromonas schubertii TaxID=652 RepID=UPI00067E7707|nr:hypothetical protein [Aeromonas schubertii]KUE80381.1 hypothetical protein ATO46_04345 [Aeromonas schubertii]MBZ6071299.1 hypothetical protein [Aeromonas schubertii]QCG47643.1 hypothetical protein E2P79_07065 [Aeromonas schubertii]
MNHQDAQGRVPPPSSPLTLHQEFEQLARRARRGEPMLAQLRELQARLTPAYESDVTRCRHAPKCVPGEVS